MKLKSTWYAEHYDDDYLIPSEKGMPSPLLGLTYLFIQDAHVYVFLCFCLFKTYLYI